MTNTGIRTTWLLLPLVAFALCGAPELVEAQTASAAPQNAPQQSAPSDRGIINPAQGPLEPVSPNEPLPQAPSSSQTQQPQPAQPQAQETRPPVQQPLGAAVGQQGVTTGGPASKPAGTAIAPAKQRQMRSLLIKVGAIAAAGAAIGTVFALSKSSPSNPPGTR